MTVRVIRLGGDEVATVRVTGGGGARNLDELADVDATGSPANVPLALRRGAEGVYRLEPAPGAAGDIEAVQALIAAAVDEHALDPAHLEQVDWFTGTGPPPPVIPGAGPGDMYVDTVTGWLYRLQ